MLSCSNEQYLKLHVACGDTRQDKEYITFITNEENIKAAPKMQVVTPFKRDPDFIKVRHELPVSLGGTIYRLNMLMHLNNLPQFMMTISCTPKEVSEYDLYEFWPTNLSHPTKAFS